MEELFCFCKFFRLRSDLSITIDEESQSYNWTKPLGILDDVLHWLQYIDFDEETLIDEAIGIMDITNGGFTYADLKSMDFDIYDTLCKRVASIQASIKNSNKE
jgi:hypothetical protein